MPKEPENLVLEHLRHIRGTTDKTNVKVNEVEQHVIELRLLTASLVRDDALVYARLAEFEARFEKIEKRLGLTDA
ncbi:MAG: hypothetical protein WC654_07460 [Patescibacteria group bacterium]